MKKQILFFLLLFSFALGQAQEAELVRDIYPGGSSYPFSFCEYQGKLFFGAREGIGLDGLWRSDGTDTGTFSILDKDGKRVAAYLMHVYKDKLFFAGGYSQFETELWVSDGTPSGTYLIKDIISGTGGSNPAGFVESAGFLFFTALNSNSYRELWKTNGTEAGTTLVKAINPGGNAYIGNLIDFKGKLFFQAEHPDFGKEIWVSDGTDTGTRPFADLNPGTKSGGFSLPAVFKDRLYFTSTGSKLFVSDGTVKGTYRVQDSLMVPQDINTPGDFTLLNGKMYFVASNLTFGKELWVSDGTDTGTRLLVETVPGYNGSNPIFLTRAGKRIFFTNMSPGNGSELWISDGTAEGTRQLKDINPGSLSSHPRRLTVVGENVFFTAQDGSNGEELWVSDGSDTGTKKIKPSFATASAPLELAAFLLSIDTTLFFSAGFDARGWELYKTTVRRPLPNALTIPAKTEIVAYPNPFSEKLFLSSPLPLMLSDVNLSDCLGREWPLEKIWLRDDGTLEINISGNLPTGVYYLYLTELGHVVKLIKH